MPVPPLNRVRGGVAGRLIGAVVVCAGMLVLTPCATQAELVRLSAGRTLSVKGHREEGESLVLLLRSGGEIVCPRDMVVEILPDEVPYPEPVTDETADEVDGTGPFEALIAAAAERHGVSARLLRAVIRVESNFEHRARSRKGAMGLMQLMPPTARQYAVNNPYDPAANIEAGARHLRMLLDRFDLSLALAAYNAGEGAVRRFGGIPPYPETRDYVRRILHLVGAAR
jgi:transglycosylase-like protein with SLT domain